ncbi:MAG TPA: carboxypeptidase regulatory-like domain-containing protein, partial [Phnomibacter sp.]|nr:carboxypeptidase regulatory-like domain-containing protein [Phnomibacter sp.]
MQRSLTLLFLFLSVAAFAQSRSGTSSVKGSVYDGQDSTPLAGATIVLLLPDDSTAAAYATTDTTGKFELKNLKNGRYLLGISFMGYAEHADDIALTTPGQVLDLGKIWMKPD